MANTKISNLTGAASVTDASVFPVVDSGSTKKVTGTQIKTYARSGLSTVAASGSYADLSNKPTLFDGNYNSLTNKPTIPSVSGLASETYVDSAIGAITIPTVPTNLSQLTNDTGFITSWGQADWNEQVSESPSYIQNKPTIPDVSGFATTSYVDSAIAGVSGGTASTGDIGFTGTFIYALTGGNVVIGTNPEASPAVGFYSFNSDGSFVLPYNVTQKANQLTDCFAGVDTVVYTATTILSSTIKLLMHVEGIEDGTQNYEAQSCEVIVASMGNKVAGSVYGLAYTSQSPLAVFTTRLNTQSQVEVVCRPTSTTEQVRVQAYATELLTTP